MTRHFLSRENPLFKRPLDSLADRDDLAIIVGAGSSIAAGLPGWRDLVIDLLARGLRENDDSLSTDEARKAAEPVVKSYGPTAAAAMARVFFGGDRDEEIRKLLYSRLGFHSFPSPIANAVSELAQVFHPNAYVATTNYDDLLERAINERGAALAALPVVNGTHDRSSDDITLSIHHLHGYIPQQGSIQGPVILDERDFALTSNSAVEHLTERLQVPGVLFVGMSFTDANVVTAGYRTVKERGGDHFALFVEESRGSSIHGLQEAVGGRLAQQGVQPIWVKSHAQVTQVLVELLLRRTFPEEYWADSSGLRYGVRIDTWREEILARWPRDSEGFSGSQTYLADALHDLGQDLERRFESSRRDERFGLDLWARSPTQTDLGYLEHWATSTRIHREPWSLAPSQMIHGGSTFPAVRAVYFGAPQQRALANISSRWQYMIALPIVLGEAPWFQLPVGAITIGSTADRKSSVLGKAPLKTDVSEALKALRKLGSELLDPNSP